MRRLPALFPTLPLLFAASLLWPAAHATSASPANKGRGPGHPLAETQGSDPCREFVARLPNVKAPVCAAAELQPTVGRSVQGRTLYQREMERFQPDLIVSIHAPYGVLDFDGPTVPPVRLGRLYLDQVGIFPGSLGNFGGVHKGMPVVTIELPSAFRTPLDAEMRQMWLDLLRWMSERVVPEQSDPRVVPVKAKKTS